MLGVQGGFGVGLPRISDGQLLFFQHMITKMYETEALKGLCKDRSVGNMLRVPLLHAGCGHSLRETAVRTRKAKLADCSASKGSRCRPMTGFRSGCSTRRR